MFYALDDEFNEDGVQSTVSDGALLDDEDGLDDPDTDQDNEPPTADDAEDDDDGGEDSDSGDTDDSDGSGNPDDSDNHKEDDDDPPPGEEKFAVQYRHETKELSREDVIGYAQKGMDYDSTKAALDTLTEEAKDLRTFHEAHAEHIEELEAFMRETGAKSIEDVLDALRVSERVAKGENAELAKERVRSARLERKLQAKTSQKDEQQANRQKAQEDLNAFKSAYPQVKVDEQFLSSLSEDLKATGNLTQAYERQRIRALNAENEALKKKLRDEKQNASNAKRSTGSQKSSGARERKKDPLLEALLSDD